MHVLLLALSYNSSMITDRRLASLVGTAEAGKDETASLEIPRDNDYFPVPSHTALESNPL